MEMYSDVFVLNHEDTSNKDSGQHHDKTKVAERQKVDMQAVGFEPCSARISVLKLINGESIIHCHVATQQ